jgi:hypothetical protein
MRGTIFKGLHYVQFEWDRRCGLREVGLDSAQPPADS